MIAPKSSGSDENSGEAGLVSRASCAFEQQRLEITQAVAQNHHQTSKDRLGLKSF
jgi:hypothetical protein